MLYIDDRWAQDIKGQIGLWESITVFCPAVCVEAVPASAVPVPDGIVFTTHRSVKEFCGQLIASLRSSRGSVIYEFAGTNRMGRLGFTLAALFGGPGVPRIITFDAPLSLISLRKGPFIKSAARMVYVGALRLFRWWALRSASGILAVGQGILNEVDPIGKFRDKCLVVPLTLFDSADVRTPRLLAQGAEVTLVCADRLSPEKGVYELVQAFGRIIEKCGGARLHLYGDGPLRNRILDFITRRSLGDRAFVHGSVPHAELLKRLRDADVLVNLTKVGDLNRTLWEGAAAGCAIIASDLGGVRSFFEDGKSALLVRPTDVGEIASALLRVCSDARFRAFLARGANELAKSNTNIQTKMRRRDWVMSMLDKKASSEA